MTDNDIVLVDFADNVLTITLNRPEARNALSRAMVEKLSAAFDRLENDPECRVAVLQAEGPSFCAGADLKEALAARTGGAPSPADEMDGKVPDLMRKRRKPLIACVEGQAFAGGLELVLVCDLLVASQTSLFALAEVKRGLLAVGGGLFRLPRRIPPAIATELLITGEAKSAEEMARYGLVNRIAAPGETRAAARELALQIAANSPVAVQAALEVTTAATFEAWSDAQGWEGQMAPFKRVRQSEDMVEGLRAFSEKRAPVWTGR